MIVDYAHTVDALLKLLKSVSELDHRRVITVFGCGGDRDKTKRPLMGKIAEEHSDLVIVTSDNPRTEDPDAIIRDITAGMKGKNHEDDPGQGRGHRAGPSHGGRRRATSWSSPARGTRITRYIGTEKIHFDDREMAARCIAG